MTATSMNQADKIKKHLPTEEAIAQRLRRLRDEMIVRNHLAGMEAKEAVHELGRELDKLASVFARRIEDAATTLPHEAKLHMYLAYFDSNARLLEMESAIKTALTGAARSAAVVAETARVKAALGRMDARDALGARRHELRKEMAQLETRGAEVLKDIEARLTKLGVEAGKII